MATPTTNTVIDPTSDPTISKKTLELALSNGGVYILDTTKDIYVTQVTENVTNQVVYPQYNTVTNLPGSTPNGIQFNENGSFASDPLLTYTNQILNANTVASYAIRTDNLLYANGAAWNFAEANYGNGNVANFLPTYNGDINPNNATFSGNVNLGDVSTISISGGNSGEALISNGLGGLAFVPVPYGGNLSNGNSRVLVYGNTNVAITVNSVSNVAVFSTTGANITGNLGVSGNLSATAVNAQVVVGNSSIVLANANIKLAANNNVVATITSSGDGILTTTGVNVAGYVSATGNITAPNLVGALSNGNSNISITGNGNVSITSGSNTVLTVTPTGVNATANITGTNFIGNFANGNSSVTIAANGNVSVTAAGTPSVVTVSSGGLTVSGNTSVSGNISIGGSISITGALNGNLANGNSNIGIAANANVVISSGGNANVLSVSPTGVAVTGTQTVSGNTVIGGGLYVGNTSVNSGLVFNGANAGNVSNVRTITLYPGTAITSNYSMILPTGLPGSNGLVLGSNTDGTLYWTTGATPNTMVNGNSNVIVSANSNVSVSVAGNANVFTVTGTGANVSGTANITGNVSAGNISATGNSVANNVSVTANLSVGNVATITGNLSAGNISTTGAFGATGNIIGGNVASNGLISTSSNVSGGNLVSGGNIIAGANITGNNVTANTLLTSVNANITGTFVAANANVTKLNANGNVSFTGGNVSLGAVGNLHITGGSNNQILTTDGNGNLTWSGGGGGTESIISNGTSNVSVLSNGDINLSTNGTANIMTVTASNVVTIAGNLNAIGANVSLGDIANMYIAGGAAGQALITDGAGNLSWGTVLGNVVTSLTNGSSSLVVGASGNVTTTVGGNATLVATSTGANIAGYANITGSVIANGLNIGNNSTATAYINLQYLYVGSSAGAEMRLYNNGASKYTSFSATGDITPTDGTGTLNANWTVGYSLTTPNLTMGAGTANFANAATVNLGSNSNVKITGGTANYFLKTDGFGNLSWAVPANVIYSNIANGTSNVEVAASGNVTIAANGGVVGTFYTDGLVITGLANITGAISAGDDVTGNNLNSIHDVIVGGDLAVNGDSNIGNIGAINGLFSGNLNTSGDLTVSGNITTANGFFNGFLGTSSNAQPNITSVGTLTSLAVTGNITSGNANLGNAVVANYFTGTLTTASNAQPNITSVGTLANLSISGNLTANGVVDFRNSANVSLGTNSNVHITGGQNGQFLQTDGSGALSWVSNIASSTVPGSATATGTAGQIAFDSGYVYICVATNTWKRAALSTW